MTRRVTSATMVGRSEELAAIGAAVASARSGQPRLVLVGGDAGIGKTRLISEACARAEQDGVLCVVGGCVQLGETSLAYAPLVVGRRGGGEEIQQARRVADQLIAQARELAARLSVDGIDLLPEPAAWLQTAEAEHAAAWGNDTAQMWADIADAWDRVGQPALRQR